MEKILKRLREANLDSKLKIAEVKAIVADHLGINIKNVKAKSMYIDISGHAFNGNAKIPFIYEKVTGELLVWDPRYKVEFLRATPFGYGGGCESIEVEAFSEEEALENAKAINDKRWGNKCPCSRYKVQPWA